MVDYRNPFDPELAFGVGDNEIFTGTRWLCAHAKEIVADPRVAGHAADRRDRRVLAGQCNCAVHLYVILNSEISIGAGKTLWGFEWERPYAEPLSSRLI